MCTTRCRTYTSFKATLVNPSATCFQAKQATRSWHVPRAVLPLSILWRNQQTEACLVLRSKPRLSQWFWAQITKPELPILRHKQKNSSHRFWGQTEENRLSGFEAKPPTNHRPWFWGSTKKPTFLISTCTLQTVYCATRLLDHPATEYPTCVTILGSLHQVSYSFHDSHRYTPCCICHLHTMRHANAILQTKQR
jgi:hypothetical protein